MNTELPPLREVIEDHGLNAKKALGQHFLLDLNITRKIARLANIQAENVVMEIGPGPGGLTRALLETGADIIAIERDHRCIGVLNELASFYPGKLTIIEADALRIDECALAENKTVKIVANLPYNISTELLIKWLKTGPELWSVMALMFQKEVADRILSAPGPKIYGRLSVIAQALSKPSRGFDLPARAFTPPPKVDSSVVLFEQPTTSFPHIAALERVTQAAFSQRRKMLRSSLKPVFGENLPSTLESANIKETQRAEEISVEQFMQLASYQAESIS